MNTQEIHIQLDILLQKISSNWNKNFLPQEKDFFLNREILKYIRQRINPLSNNKKQGAFDIIQRIENLNTLIKTVSLTINNINQKEANVELPFDFLSYISSEVDTYLICSEDNLQLEEQTIFYQTLDPPPSITGLDDFLLTLTYDLTAISPIVVELCNSFDEIPIGYFPQDNIEDYKKSFIFKNALIAKCIENLPEGFEFRFNNETQLLEFKGTQPFVVHNVLNYTIEGLPTTFDVFAYDSSKIINKYVLETELISEVGIIDEEFKRSVKNSSLSSSKDNYLVGILRNKEILLTKSQNAVNTNCIITYYKKPRIIDLLLGINSELPNEVLDEIISNTAQTMKAVISSDTYEKYVQENLLIE